MVFGSLFYQLFLFHGSLFLVLAYFKINFLCMVCGSNVFMHLVFGSVLKHCNTPRFWSNVLNHISTVFGSGSGSGSG